METEHLRSALDNLQDELKARMEKADRANSKVQQAMREADEAEVQVAEMYQAIKVIESVLRGTANRLETTNDFVKSALKSVHTPVRDDELLEMIIEQGWTTESSDPLSVLRTIISRMINDDEIIRVKPRVYALRKSSWVTVDEDGELSQPVSGALLASDGAGGVGEA